MTRMACYAVMDDQTGAESFEARRSRAVLAFLGAGLHAVPSRASAVTALADARRAVAACLARGGAIDEWLAGEIRFRGIRENAAVLAVLEIPERQAEAAAAYSREHPDRTEELSALLTVTA